MLQRTQLVCVWCAPVGLLLLAVGFFPVAHYFPVPAPSWSAHHIAAFYRDHPTRTRVGLLMCFLGVAAWGPFNAVLARQMLRVPPRLHPMALLQVICSSVTWIFLALPLLVLEVAAFRPDRSIQITQTLHDLGWILFIMPFMPFVVQNLAIGVLVLQDRSPNPLFPRWMAYFNFWVALLFLPGGVLVFFKSGPFAYDGILAFYIPVVIFCVWFVVMPLMVRRAILAEPDPDPADPFFGPVAQTRPESTGSAASDPTPAATGTHTITQ